MATAELRRQLRRQRQAVCASERRLAEQSCWDHLRRARHFQRARAVALYRAVGSELSLASVLQQAPRRRKRCYLPRVRGRHMDMLPAETMLRCGPFGLLQPQSGRPRPPWAFALVLVPLLGFDREGHRIGQGGGYYDRWLARCRYRRPILIGVAFDCQELPAIQPAPWDQSLDAILTPSGLHWVQ